MHSSIYKRWQLPGKRKNTGPKASARDYVPTQGRLKPKYTDLAQHFDACDWYKSVNKKRKSKNKLLPDLLPVCQTLPDFAEWPPTLSRSPRKFSDSFPSFLFGPQRQLFWLLWHYWYFSPFSPVCSEFFQIVPQFWSRQVSAPIFSLQPPLFVFVAWVFVWLYSPPSMSLPLFLCIFFRKVCSVSHRFSMKGCYPLMMSLTDCFRHFS